MAYPDVTYSDYSTWGGALTEDAFSSSVKAATAFVKYICGFNVPETEVEIHAFKNAVCAACDVENFYGGSLGQGVSSLSIGSFSISGGQEESSCAHDMMERVYHELSGTGLLYQGIA